MNSAQTAVRAGIVLKVVGRLGGARFTELVNATGFANPILRRLLLALIESDLVVHDRAKGLYRLGSEAYILGQLARPYYGFHELARDSLVKLAEHSGDTVFLSSVEGLSTVCLHREEGKYPIRTHVLKVGDRHPLGLGAASIAILAAMSGGEVDNVLNTNSDRIRELRADISIDQIKSQVEEARDTRIAVSLGLMFPGSSAIATTICAPSGDVLGALTIAAIDSRMDHQRQQDLAVPLLREAAQVEDLLARFGQGGIRFEERVDSD